MEGFSHFLIFCSEALDFYLLVHGFPFTKEVTSEHLHSQRDVLAASWPPHIMQIRRQGDDRTLHVLYYSNRVSGEQHNAQLPGQGSWRK
ncbi:MAG TPA: hypothetical protein VGF67_08115 [Ktedonobacteraceae bacterium]